MEKEIISVSDFCPNLITAKDSRWLILSMIKYRLCSTNLCFLLRQSRNLASCPLQVEEVPVPSVYSAPPADHKTLCFSLVEQLLGHGLFSCAQGVIQRIISQCSSIPEALSAINFAVERGMELDSDSYSSLIQKLVCCGEAQLAESLYVDFLLSRDIKPNLSLLNSMIICYCELGKLDEAKLCIDKVVGMKSLPIHGACSALIKQFCAQDRFLEGFGYFVKISDADILLNSMCYNRLVNNLCYRGYLDEALYVFDVMCDNGVPPTVHLCKSLIFEFCKRGRVEEAELLSAEMESYGFYMDKVLYTSLIYQYCRKKKIKLAMRLFLRMIKMGCEPDNHTYNTLIDGYLNLGLFDKGWVLHNLMSESGLQPDSVTYQIMISKYCKDHKVDCALTLLNNMVRCNIKPAVHTYTVLIAALFEENRLREVNQLFNMMLDNGLVPDHVLFFTLVKNHPKGSELLLALDVVQAIARNGCHRDISAFSTSTSLKHTRDIMDEIEQVLEEISEINLSFGETAFSIYMIALCYGGKLDDALPCIDRMVSHGFLPLLSAYNSLIKCLYQEGLVEDAKYLVDIMQDHGLVPDIGTFLIMVHEHCKRGDFLSAFDLLDEMEERGLKQDVSVYDTVISHLGREFRVLEAEKLFHRMLEAGIEPDETIYATMINAYSKSGLATKAHELFEKMLQLGVQPSSHSYTALINGLIKKNMTEKGCVYIDRMLEEGIMPNAVFYTSLINQFLRKREFEFALRLVDLMERSCIDPDLITHITLASGICRNIRRIERKQPPKRWKKIKGKEKSKKEKEMLFRLLHKQIMLPSDTILKVAIRSQEDMKIFALRLNQKIKNAAFMPNLFLYNARISGFCWTQRMEEAYTYLDLMQSEGLRPNEVTFTILMDGHLRIGETDLAVGLFNRMNASGCFPDRVVYDTLIKGFCKVGRLQDALSVSHMMQKRGFSPSRASYENLLNVFCALYSSDHALKIVDDMLAHGYIPCRYNLGWLMWLLRADSKVHEAHLVHDLLLIKERAVSDNLSIGV